MKRPGYAVKISCFIEASPTDMEQMRLAISAIDAACEALRQDGFQMVKHVSRFMLSREVPDAEHALVSGGGGGGTKPQEITITMPPIPAALDRRKA